MKKTMKKINLLLSIIGTITFLIGNYLQQVNLRPETEMMPIGLNQLAYFGTIILSLSLIGWLVNISYFIFNAWQKNKNLHSVIVFGLSIPSCFSLLFFIVYELIKWHEWYMIENYYAPIYKLIWLSLRGIETNMVFWFILITTISIMSGLMIFLKPNPEKI